VAVTFDSTFEKGVASQGSPFSFASNAGDVTGTVSANSNRVLIACIAFRTGDPTGVAITWNGVAMTAIGSEVEIAGGQGSVYLFGLIAPDTGNQTISASWTGGTQTVALGAVSLYNADQSTGWQNAGSDTGTGTSALSTVTSANGNMGVVGHVNDNASGMSIAQGTSAWIETDLNGNYAQGYRASAGATVVVEWTLGESSVAWGNSKVDVIAFAAGGAATIRKSSLTTMGVS
jgi:hypothetical protein